jgi:Phage integrase, N-terminal SAM-like domain
MNSTKLIDLVRSAIRTKNYSPRTEQAYWFWIKQFILFHQKRHAYEMGEPEVSAFLSHLGCQQESRRLDTEPGPKRVALSLQCSFFTEKASKNHLIGSTTSNAPRNHPGCQLS